jgi:hypothetical protein
VDEVGGFLKGSEVLCVGLQDHCGLKCGGQRGWRWGFQGLGCRSVGLGFALSVRSAGSSLVECAGLEEAQERGQGDAGQDSLR